MAIFGSNSQKQSLPFMIRWFLALIGMMFFRWPGAILGFIVGVIIDNMNAGKSYSQGRGPFSGTRTQVTPADFELNLLSVASLVIKADGQWKQPECVLKH